MSGNRALFEKLKAGERYPFPGIWVWKNQFDIRVVRLHYSADPLKDEKWIEAERARAVDKEMFEQEMEINFGARLGQKLFPRFQEEFTVERSFPIPRLWTRFFALDPHPVVPHAALWGACDPFGDLWIYREYWPSKVYGKPGNIPEDDNQITVEEYMRCCAWLESAGNPQNGAQLDSDGNVKLPGFRERVYKRAIDYAARAFGQGTSDDDESDNFQKRFEDAAELLAYGDDSGRPAEFPGFTFYLEDAIKDKDVGIGRVNQWLTPREYDDGKGGWVKKSKLRIFGDNCPELVWQLKTNRRKMLTAQQAEVQDPVFKVFQKRNHLTDCLRYIIMMEPEFVETKVVHSTHKNLQSGVWY